MSKRAPLYSPTPREGDIIRADQRAHSYEVAINPKYRWCIENDYGHDVLHFETAIACCIVYMSNPNAKTIIYKPMQRTIAMTREFAAKMNFESPDAMRRDILKRLQLRP